MSPGSESVELLAGCIVLLLSGAVSGMFAQRSAVYVKILIEEPSGREFSILLVGVDLADNLATEEKEIIQVPTNGGAREFLYFHEVGDEGLEFLDEFLAAAQVNLILVLDLPGSRPLGHPLQSLLEGCSSHVG